MRETDSITKLLPDLESYIRFHESFSFSATLCMSFLAKVIILDRAKIPSSTNLAQF